MSKDEKKLRYLLWLKHGCPSHYLYGDDGEMQCNNPNCMIDFKRDTVKRISQIFEKQEIEKIKRQIECMSGPEMELEIGFIMEKGLGL